MSALAQKVIPARRKLLGSKSPKTRILIVSDNPAASRSVAVSLRGLDFDVLLCLFDGRTLTSTPVKAPDAILCHLTDYVEMSPKIAKVVRQHYAPRQLPLIGALSRPAKGLTDEFDSTVFAPMHASQIANRVSSMIRLGTIEAEIHRRVATLREDFNEDVELGDMSPDRPFRVLFIGKASPAFMVVINALQDKGVEVVAAFTSFSAFDYLHGDPFDAVIMNALEQPEPALSISETMRKNTKLYHVPTLFLVNDSFEDRDTAYARGARDIVSVKAEPEEIRGRILELANYHRVHEQMKRELFELVSDKHRDGSGTVFSRTFFDAHLVRCVDYAAKTQQNLSLIGLSFTPDSFDTIENDSIENALVETGVMIQDMVRMQDVVCRHEDGFLMALNETSELDAQHVLDRIKPLLETFSFKTTSAGITALTLSASTAILEVKSGETASQALRSLLHELEQASV